MFDLFKFTFPSIKPNYLFIVLLATISLFAAIFIFNAPRPVPDRWDQAILHVVDRNSAECMLPDCGIIKSRLLNSPIYVYVSSGASYIFGNIYAGMLFHNLIYYFLFIFLFYKFALLIFKSDKIAFFSTIFLVAQFNTFNSLGISYLTDVAPMFYMLLASYFAIKYYDSKNNKYYYYCIIASVVGMFYKETGPLGMLTLGMVILFERSAWSIKIKKILKAAILFLILPIIYHISFYFIYNYSYFDWYNYVVFRFGNIGPTNIERVKLFTVNMFRLFIVAWPVIIYGITKIKKLSWREIVILLSFIPASLTFIIWPALSIRILYVFVPLGSLLAGYGLYKINRNIFVYAIIVLYILSNYFYLLIDVNIIQGMILNHIDLF